MSRTAAEWAARPKLPPTHYVDTRLYTDEGLFREEQEKIFDRSWIIACHESELPAPYDYRTFRHPGGKELFVIRGADGDVRAFYNVCPHRGNVLLHDPAGNARAITCIFHAWTFDCEGHCTGIARRKEGYQDRLSGADLGLRRVRTAVGYGGFVWVNVDDGAPSLGDWIGPALETLDPFLRQPLEVFHYQKVVVQTNYKLWHDTNSEFYHDYMHYFNRVTGHAAARLLPAALHAVPQRARRRRLDGGPLRSLRGQRGARRRLARADAGRLDPGRSVSRHHLQPAHVGDPPGHRDPACAKPGDDRVPRPGAEGRHARDARRPRARPQPDLGPVRAQPARGSAGRAGAGDRDAGRPHRQPLGAARARGGPHHPRRDRDAALLRDVEPLHGPFAVRSVRARAGSR